MEIVLKVFIAVILISVSCSVHSTPQDDGLFIVNTTLGGIQGRYLKSRLGKSFLAFRGIRYAEAPVDDLRFQPPVPVKPWNDTFDATDDGPMCVQFSQNLNEISEDCLRLNVYTRNVCPTRKRAVLIYFHPGGYYQLSAQSKTVAGPEHLMDRNVVLVTANYRLGILGFISTGTKEAPGNNGLKDQVQVMRWVKEHIDKFGGDPDSVTLMGYSAGAMSITLHMVSPMSQGLFHRAIVMSGAAVAQWDIPSEQLDLAKKQARLLNCSDESVDSVFECLKDARKEDIGNSTPKMFEFAGGNPIILFKPVVERDFGQERFLTQNPNCLFRSGQFAKVDVLTGITEFEFVYPAIQILGDETLRQEMSKKFTQLAPICFLYERDTDNSKRITARLRSHFFNNANSTDWLTFKGLKDLFADGVIGYGAHRFVQSAPVTSCTAMYFVTPAATATHCIQMINLSVCAVHHDELLYLFRVPVMTPPFNQTDPENLIIKNLTGWWSNFAQTGNPNEGDYASQVTWEPSTPSKPQYLEIDKKATMKNKFFYKRYEIWDNLFSVDNECK